MLFFVIKLQVQHNTTIIQQKGGDLLKRLLGIITFSFLFIIVPNSADAKENLVQQLVDHADAGDTVHIPSGIYEEPIIIDKPITVIGNKDVYFTINNHKQAITIDADNVSLQHISINYHSDRTDGAALVINSNRNQLDHITIETTGRGIFLDNAHENILHHITLRGNERLPIQSRQRGIDMWKSNENTIHDSTISHVEDGIYIESSSHNVVYDNRITYSRYGYHLMFTKETELYRNESAENISGMMIMGTNGTKVYENKLTFNQKNVQSLGLLLFDVQNAIIKQNKIAHNRIGIFVEDATENELMNNDVTNNFIGLQFKRAEHNVIYNNAFSANVVQGQAEDSMNNETNYNYWSDHQGLDIDGDRLSNLTYKVDPFYLHLTNEYPPYRLLFQSPGFVFLENMMHTPIEQQLVDQTPLIDNPLDEAPLTKDNNKSTFIVSTIFLTLSLLTIYMGVKK